jgi:NAD(P)-dependent dehydrogenase (short-subunit alcohol dehydrogenase family)
MAVAVCARSVDQLDEVAAEVEAAGGQALVVPGDVTDRVSVESVVARVEGDLGPIELLVNNAGACGAQAEFLDADPDDWWRTVEVNLRGPALCSYYVLKRMAPRRRGRIVNVVSDAALRPAPLGSDHACSKAALVRLTDSLALAAWEHGIAVFAVGPGLLPAAEVASLEALARLVADLAAGRADRLSGRLLHLQDDLDELLQRVEEVEREELYQLRLRRLGPQPVEEPPPAEDEAAAGEATAGEAPAEEAAAAGSAPVSS